MGSENWFVGRSRVGDITLAIATKVVGAYSL